MSIINSYNEEYDHPSAIDEITLTRDKLKHSETLLIIKEFEDGSINEAFLNIKGLKKIEFIFNSNEKAI